MMSKDELIYLVALCVFACGVLALITAYLSGDKKLMGALFSTANHLFSLGAGTIIGLLAGRLH